MKIINNNLNFEDNIYEWINNYLNNIKLKLTPDMYRKIIDFNEVPDFVMLEVKKWYKYIRDFDNQFFISMSFEKFKDCYLISYSEEEHSFSIYFTEGQIEDIMFVNEYWYKIKENNYVK